MDTAKDTKKQITKAWGEGLPTRPGRWLVCNADETNARILRAVETEPGTVAVFEGGQMLRNDANLRHFGPLPGIERSIKAQSRSTAASPTPS
jgi:hypothetical protein